MNSRETVQRTLAFTGPERVARSFSPSDFIHAGPTLPEGEWQLVDGAGGNHARWQRVDAWGNVWGRVDPTSKGEVIRGGLVDLADAESVPLPDFADPALYDEARAAFAVDPERWRLGFVHGLSFSMARKLRKLDQYFMDLMLASDQVAVLHDRIDAAVRQQIDGLGGAGADGIFFAEDWGTQRGLFIHPDTWCAVFKPRFAALCAYAHERGLKVFMHSCGAITAIIPDLIEAGIDVFQFDQPLVHGLETLAAFQEAGGVTFWCPVDIQAVLPCRDEARIRAGARRMLDVLWRGRGGFIAGCYPDPVSLGLGPGVQDWASDEFLSYGTAARYLSGV